jgi:hypothetical protein
MKTWKMMYLVIWMVFLQIIFIMFSPLPESFNVAVHLAIGAAVFGLAVLVARGVSASSCPERIKRITLTTRNLAALQGVLGVVLAAGDALSLGSLFSSGVGLVHVANALAMITQASSSATAYDMWEEKEFQTGSSTP